MNPTIELCNAATKKSLELEIPYGEAVEYILRNNPALAKAFREFTITSAKGEIDHHLSKAASEYRPSGFIADQVFPQREAPVKLKAHSLKVDVPVEDRANTDPVFIEQFEANRVHRVQDALFADWELQLAQEIVRGASGAGVSTPWTYYGEAHALLDLKDTASNIYRATGHEPNRVLFSGTAWRHFRRNARVIKAIQESGKEHVTGGLYPSVRDIEGLLGMKVLVGNAWHNASTEPIGLDLSQIWDDHALVYYASKDPSFGYNHFSKGAPGFTVKRLSGEQVEVSHSHAGGIGSPLLGKLILHVTRSTL